MKTITVSLDSFLILTLGPELKGIRELPDKETGLILSTFFNKGTEYKVQFNDWDGSELERPILWDYPLWYNSSTNYKLQKERSEKARIERWILDANVKIVTAFIMRELQFPEDPARSTAYSLLIKKKFGNIRAICPERMPKLVTKEEELK